MTEMVHVIFKLYTDVKQLLECESHVVCQSAALLSNCSALLETEHFDDSFTPEDLQNLSNNTPVINCMNMLNEMKLCVEKEKEKLLAYEKQTKELHEILLVYLLFLKGFDTNEQLEKCFFHTKEALNMTNK